MLLLALFEGLKWAELDDVHNMLQSHAKAQQLVERTQCSEVNQGGRAEGPLAKLRQMCFVLAQQWAFAVVVVSVAFELMTISTSSFSQLICGPQLVQSLLVDSYNWPKLPRHELGQLTH